MDIDNSPATKKDIELVLQAIESLRVNFDTRLAATDARLTEQETRIDARFEDLETRLRKHFAERLDTFEASLREEISTRLEAMETRLLGAFFNYQEYDRIENRKFRTDLSNISAAADLRLDNLETRIAAIEKIILTNPNHPPAS